MNLRIGHGYDLHRLVEGRPLILGGITIPHTRGLSGHSDADAVTHAFIDAVLSAAGLGDIGRLFPDSDDQYKDADSLELLRQVMNLVRKQQAGWQFVDASITIIAELPKLAPHIPSMEAALADAASIEQGRVRITAKTNEGVGPEGRQEAVSVHAVALLSYSPDHP